LNNIKGGDHLVDVGIYWRIVLKLIFKKQIMKVTLLQHGTNEYSGSVISIFLDQQKMIISSG
jgi:hypothetical protein